MHWLDPDYLPEISGTFERFLLNPHGDADGMILSDGTEVHFPPHMSAELCAAIRPGEKPEIRIRGVRPRNSSLIAAIAIETMDGKRIVDNGPPKKHAEKERPNKDGPKPKHEKMQAEAVGEHQLLVLRNGIDDRVLSKGHAGRTLGVKNLLANLPAF